MKNRLFDSAYEYFEYVGDIECAEHSHIITRIADVLVFDKKKTEKIMQELLYDPVIYDDLQMRILPYFALDKSISSFDLLWKQLRQKLMRIQFSEPLTFEAILAAIIEKTYIFEYTGGIKTGNIFTELKVWLGKDNEQLDVFLCDIYSLNSQIGKNPSGKGEYFLDLFVKTAKKSSDVEINGIEFEIKTTNAPVGESLGSKITYIENIMSIYEKSGMKFVYETFSFGKKNFNTKWAPIFIEMTKVSPTAACELIKYQHDFFLQREMSTDFRALVDEYLLTPSLEYLINIYDDICRRYIQNSMENKVMLVFSEVGVGEKRKPTGDYICFDDKSVREAVSFAGSNECTLTKVILPKSSATMRPEIQFNTNI